jgi:hypothetical protein
MKTDNNNALYMIIYFIVTLLVAWVAFSLIITWFNPQLTDSNGNVNWWTTLWVSALIIVFSWLFMLIIYFIINLFSKKCPKVECDPCAVPKQTWSAQCPQPCPPPPCPQPCPPAPCPQPCPPPPCPRPQAPCPPPPCPRPQDNPPSPGPQPCSYPCTKPYMPQCGVRQSNMGQSNMGGY